MRLGASIALVVATSVLTAAATFLILMPHLSNSERSAQSKALTPPHQQPPPTSIAVTSPPSSGAHADQTLQRLQRIEESIVDLKRVQIEMPQHASKYREHVYLNDCDLADRCAGREYPSIAKALNTYLFTISMDAQKGKDLILVRQLDFERKVKDRLEHLLDDPNSRNSKALTIALSNLIESLDSRYDPESAHKFREASLARIDAEIELAKSNEEKGGLKSYKEGLERQEARYKKLKMEAAKAKLGLIDEVPGSLSELLKQ